MFKTFKVVPKVRRFYCEDHPEVECKFTLIQPQAKPVHVHVCPECGKRYGLDKSYPAYENEEYECHKD
jgi:hypothetical protein